MKIRCDVHVAPGLTYECVADAAAALVKGDRVIIQCERYEDAGTVTRVCGGACGCAAAHAAPAPSPAAVAEDIPSGAEATPCCAGPDASLPPAAPVREPQEHAAEHDEREEGHEGGSSSSIRRRLHGQAPPTVLRRLTPADENRLKDREVRTSSLLRTAVQKIKDHRLDMKVIQLHLVFDRSLLILQFTADGRVDFRELLRDLSRTLHVRVELRQIGVRDETAVLGGIGCCGRPFCCASFLADFQSVNVRMAKEQGLSLNPVNISGACGRLKCCLRYEASGYREMLKTLPKVGSHCDTPEGPGKVNDVNPLTRRVRVFIPPRDNSDSRFADFDASEVKPRLPPPPPQRRPGGSGGVPPRSPSEGGAQVQDSAVDAGQQPGGAGGEPAAGEGPRRGGDHRGGGRPQQNSDRSRSDRDRGDRPRPPQGGGDRSQQQQRPPQDRERRPERQERSPNPGPQGQGNHGRRPPPHHQRPPHGAGQQQHGGGSGGGRPPRPPPSAPPPPPAGE